MNRLKYIGKRVLLMLLTLFIIAAITFFLTMNLPGSPYPNVSKLTVDQVHALDIKYGLDRPIIIQFFNYITDALQGNWQFSFYDQTPIAGKLIQATPISFKIGILAVLFGSTVGVLLGLAAAIYKNSFVDYFATFIAVLGVSIPSFVIAAITQYFFAVKLGWVPVLYTSGTGLQVMILPILSLSVFAIASMARYTRTEMIETLNSNFVLLARAKGVKKSAVIFKHAFRNALVPIITVLGPQVVSIMTGSLVVETIFGIPGIGGILSKSILRNDYYMIIGSTIFLSTLFLISYLIIDILYSIVDPRINIEGGN